MVPFEIHIAPLLENIRNKCNSFSKYVSYTLWFNGMMKTVNSMVSQAATRTKLSNTTRTSDQFCAPKPWNKVLMRKNPLLVWCHLSSQSPLKLKCKCCSLPAGKIHTVTLSHWNNYFYYVLSCSMRVERAHVGGLCGHDQRTLLNLNAAYINAWIFFFFFF